MFRVGRHTYVGGMCRSYRYPLPATPSGGAGLDGSPASPSQEHAFTSRWDGVQHEGGITDLAAGVRCCPLITARTGWHESLRLVRPGIDFRTCVLVCQMVLAGGDLRVAALFRPPPWVPGFPDTTGGGRTPVVREGREVLRCARGRHGKGSGVRGDRGLGCSRAPLPLGPGIRRNDGTVGWA